MFRSLAGIFRKVEPRRSGIVLRLTVSELETRMLPNERPHRLDCTPFPVESARALVRLHRRRRHAVRARRRRPDVGRVAAAAVRRPVAGPGVDDATVDPAEPGNGPVVGVQFAPGTVPHPWLGFVLHEEVASTQRYLVTGPYFRLRRSASLKSEVALSYSFLANHALPRAVKERASFGSRRIASVKSATALSYSFLSRHALPREV